ncbi:hypothetical protein RCC89_18390 [Cytophagaceae bacterium ABcell3]|nr:hypothetical protein RCC89_18390 [Cytophagaceae bacterium ABcell3]
MTGESKVTIDHNQIRKWAEARKGKPVVVEETQKGKGTGIVRISFPYGKYKTALKEISWDEFFEMFEENNLAMVYQEKTKTGNISRFSKFVDRDAVKESGALETSLESPRPKVERNVPATNRPPANRKPRLSPKKAIPETTDPGINYIEYTSPDTGPGEIRSADDPHGAEYSGIPGTDSNDDIGEPLSGGSASGTKGRGSASHGKPGGGVPEE